MAENRNKEQKKEKMKEDRAKSKSENKVEEQVSETTEILDITTFAEYKKIEQELITTTKKVQDAIDLAKIYKSDMERIKERFKLSEAELQEKLTIELASKLLRVLDNFEKSFDHIEDDSTLKGFRMIYQSLVDVLTGMKIERFESAGLEFDADKMNAIMGEPAKEENQKGKVAQVFAEGYIYLPTEKIVRYAQVSVYN